MSRLNNSIRNVTVAVIGQIFILIITLIARMVFVKYLSIEYLGINGLFGNIMSFLALADLGIGGAMIFSLYKPIAENDRSKIVVLMQLYKRIYTYIGLTVLILGLSITPFLNFIIKDMPDIDNLYFIFVLYVLNSASTYLFTYKRSLIIANQKEYISTIFMYSRLFIVNSAQIIILIYTQNFILFLSIQFIFNFIENILISYVANKMYPFLKTKTTDKLDKFTQDSIIKNIKALMIHKIGTVVVFSTDNIILSSQIGVGIVGLYSNYLLIINAVNTLIGKFFSAITASVGNLSALEDENIINARFLSVNFFGFWVYGFCSISLLVLLNPFIELWLGKKYLFEVSVILVISINFFVNGMRQATLTFKTAMGLFWYDRYKPLYEAIVNLIVSIVLVQFLGIIGVILGTVISSLFICSWIEPYVLYKYGLKAKVSEYFKKYAIYTVVTIVASYITMVAASFVTNPSFLGFSIKLFICIIVPNLVFIICFFRTKEFKYLSSLGFKIIGVKLNSKLSRSE
ncbi:MULTISPECIES: hypothetical protein [Bacillaceae]|uniref:lipopolysaccharide biosynthesis protein n=1 Tax=Bacillaceae TaxID=186817 RepID=UPI000BF4136A|nr:MULTISPECIES: hypothetical protein [Bacillaceae]PEZ83318.1 hypothetical protein CN380_02835 [Bacillus sp. AFS017274]